VEGIRLIQLAPGEYGPTGPPHITVLVNVPTGGTCLNIDSDPALSDLRTAVNSDNPLMLAAEVGNIYYSFATFGTGARADAGMGVFGPTAINQCGVLFANTRTTLPEQAPHGAKGLKISAGPGGTATLRIWSTG